MFSNQAIVAYNVVKDKSKLTNCFTLHIAHNNLSAHNNLTVSKPLRLTKPQVLQQQN